jgi:hypothetical protein
MGAGAQGMGARYSLIRQAFLAQSKYAASLRDEGKIDQEAL